MRANCSLSGLRGTVSEIISDRGCRCTERERSHVASAILIVLGRHREQGVCLVCTSLVFSLPSSSLPNIHGRDDFCNANLYSDRSFSWATCNLRPKLLNEVRHMCWLDILQQGCGVI